MTEVRDEFWIAGHSLDAISSDRLRQGESHDAGDDGANQHGVSSIVVASEQIDESDTGMPNMGMRLPRSQRPRTGI